MKLRLFLAAAVVFAILFIWIASEPQIAHAQSAPFYQGKTMRIIVGYSPGGFYDLWGRLLSRHLGKHIPGLPNIIVENMEGAGSLVAANHAFNVAKPDGLTLLMPSNSIYLEQLVGRPEVRFDVNKFFWIGSQEKNHVVLYMRADAPYKSIRDILNAKEPPKCGSTGTSGEDYRLARVLDETMGIKIKTILGYGGGPEVDLAVERGEVICRGISIPPHFGREPFITWHKKGFDRHLLQTGRKPDPRLPDVPTIYELMDELKTPDESRRVAQVILSVGEFGRPMLAPPGTPPERVKILRDAYTKALKDPELLAEAKKGKMDVEPSAGEELQGLVKEVMAQPPDVIARVKKVLLQ